MSHRKRPAGEAALALASREVPLPADAKRPATIALGAAFILFRAIGGLLWLGSLALVWNEVLTEAGIPPEDGGLAFAVVAVLVGGGVLVLLVLGVLIWRGSNIARVLVMAGLTASTLTAAIGYFSSGEEIRVQTTLFTVALDILVLLALSSRDARAWARRPRRR